MATLKRLTSTIVLIITAFIAASQDFNNIEFIENKGQWDSQVKFKGDIDAGAVFIRSSGFTILKHNQQDFAALQSGPHGHDAKNSATKTDGKKVIRSHAWNVDFIGASPLMQVIPEKSISAYNNYFIGNDPSKWAGECRIYQAITLKNVYPNVDVRYYTYNGTLKYDIVAKPGADISKIALKYNGADKVQVKDKELLVSTSLGDFRESYPYTYQSGFKERKEIGCKYIVKDNIVRFEVKDYDPAAVLVIDPSLIFCSLTASAANNWGFTATYGPDGSFFGGGIVFSNSFPVSPGALQNSFGGGDYDMGIIKLSSNGANRIYATYIGGNGEDQPHSLVVNAQGELIIAGRTNSVRTGNGAYPITGSLIGTCGGEDIVVTKLNATGSNLIGSRRIGGTGDDGVNIKSGRSGPQSLERNYGDDGRSEVIIDGANNIYVASCTRSVSNQASDKFPASAGAFQQTFGGGSQDGVVLKFSSDLSINLFASFLGGGGTDAAYVLSLGPSGNIYVAGGTESFSVGGNPATNNFPGNKAGTIGPTPLGLIDGFIAVISNDGSSLIRSTYIGTSGIDQVYGIQFDRSGFPYIVGQTTGSWTVVNAIYSNANAKQFIGKLQPDLSAYVYSTMFGTSSANPNISPTAFLVDRCENVYVSGWGGGIAPDGPSLYPSAGTNGLPVTGDALKSTTDGKDFYFFVLKRDATQQLFGSFFGQNGGYGDHVDGGTSRFDVNGVIYQGICANCGGGAVFPTTPGVWGPSKPASAFCNLGMVKISFNLAGVGAEVQSAIGGVPSDTAGCFPLDVTFTDQVRNATEYIWNFGDGSGNIGPLPAATGYTQTHTFTTVGTYRVMLIAIDPGSCNIRDTSYINIRVGDLKANLAADYSKSGGCMTLDYIFHNRSTTDVSRPFTDTSFIWDFGDGSLRIRAGMNDVPHTFPAPGPYNVKLILRDTAYCNNPDSITISVRVATNVEAEIETPTTGCAPYDASFTGNGGLTYQWDFGDPASGANNISTLSNPTHLYSVPGIYTVVMVATDPNTCNITDTDRITITVYEKPTADFSFTPVTPIENTPNIFTNLASANATRFKWVFGDGDSLITTSRNDVTHQYNSTGTFTACLYAYNDIGCYDSACKQVSTIINPALDVPNAFTPNSGDINSVVMVKGFGISKMRFIIWNRWGQKVFETGNRLQGWDGKVKGVVQPMDVYAYTLDVEFFDGKKVSKKGDITLIR